MDNTRIFKMPFASVYPYYIQKAEKKGRTKAEVDAIIFWLTGYNKETLKQHLDKKTDLKLFSIRHHKSIQMSQKLQE